ncbi:MAG: hypothetical protein K2M95_00205 [Clostridiales bacterium]|nr:hypothetical protein [Clostridiales bacterium]
MASLPHASGAPVFNLRLTNADSGVSYWLYVQSSGFVYFNHDSDTGHNGLQLSYSDALFEFKVPLYMFGLQSGTHISSVVVSVQDSAANWAQTGRITFEGDYTVACDFPVYSVHQSITRKNGGAVTLSVETSATLVSVQWLKDGEELAGQTGQTLTLENLSAADAGEYSVRLTTAAGNEKTVPIAALSVI